MTPEQIAKLVSDLVSAPLGDQLKSIHGLQQEVAHLKRQVGLLMSNMRAQQHRALVRTTESDDDDY